MKALAAGPGGGAWMYALPPRGSVLSKGAWSVSSSGKDHSTVEGTDVSKSEVNTAAMRAAFWSWIVIIGAGLLVMIVLPLAGR